MQKQSERGCSPIQRQRAIWPTRPNGRDLWTARKVKVMILIFNDGFPILLGVKLLNLSVDGLECPQTSSKHTVRIAGRNI